MRNSLPTATNLRIERERSIACIFARQGDNDCEKKFSYERGQNFEDAFEGDCLNSVDHEKLRMLKQTLDRFFSQELTKYHCRGEFDGRIVHVHYFELPIYPSSRR